MMMDEEFDIEAEYERLHGPVFRKTLFDEEEYESLKTQILVEPRAALSKYYMGSVFSEENVQSLRMKMMSMLLPFSGFVLNSSEYAVLEEILGRLMLIASRASSCHLGKEYTIKECIEDDGVSLEKNKNYREYVPKSSQKPDLLVARDSEKKSSVKAVPSINVGSTSI